MNKKFISIVGVIAVVLAVVITWFVSKPKNVVPVGAPGNMLAEQYDPYVQYNGGFNTALGITNSGDFTQSGASTLSGAATFSSTLNATGATTLATLTQGGGIRATSTVNSAETLLAADFDVENVIAYTLNVQNATLTLPATSTLSSFIGTAGQTRTIFIRNATTTAKTLTIAGGTGMNLLVASSTNAIVGNTSGSNSARLDFVRRADTDIDVMMSIFLK